MEAGESKRVRPASGEGLELCHLIVGGRRASVGESEQEMEPEAPAPP